tara:strand:+ start:181 stop:882 length:702 start_codon:yes stop_codon:yes gene_type:complete
MIKKYEGIIVFLKKIKDNDLYIRILNNKDKLVSGIVYGGNSSKKKQIFQTGYFLEFSILQKNINAVSSINAEISKPFISYLIEDKYKSYCLMSIISLINLSIVEGQKVNGLYISVKDILNFIIKNKNWIKSYCIWLFNLLEIIGYQVDYIANNEYKYYNLRKQEFENILTNNSIVFPHDIFIKDCKINFEKIEAIFSIFESIYSKNHLDNINYTMPDNFINFKNSILNKLKND